MRGMEAPWHWCPSPMDAEDDPNRTRYLTTAEIDMDRGELRKLAVANLKRLLPKIEMRNHYDVFSILSRGVTTKRASSCSTTSGRAGKSR